MLYMISVSFMTAGEASNQYLLPRELKFENYVNVWTSNNFQQYTLNSIIISAIVVLGSFVYKYPSCLCICKDRFSF